MALAPVPTERAGDREDPEGAVGVGRPRIEVGDADRLSTSGQEGNGHDGEAHPGDGDRWDGLQRIGEPPGGNETQQRGGGDELQAQIDRPVAADSRPGAVSGQPECRPGCVRDQRVDHGGRAG